MVQVVKKPRESTASLIRRFSRAVQVSRTLLEAKSKKYRSRPVTERKEKRKAIMREHLRKLRSSLEKTGQYSEELFQKDRDLRIQIEKLIKEIKNR